MCGLLAGIGKLNTSRIITLGSLNEDRGKDSTGLAYVAGGEIKLAKTAERASVALNMSLRKDVTEAALSGLFIGHTRQATQGAVNERNAHPFLVDGIAFAHNGIIINDDDFGKYEVDSESLIHGIKARDFSKFEGCIALVWIEGGQLKAYRCGNPLFRGRFGGSTYLASQRTQLQAIGCTHIRELGEGLIYTFLTPEKITTERVPKNEVWTYTYKGSALENDYDYGTYGTYKPSQTVKDVSKPNTAITVLTPAERQAKWWLEEKKERAAILKEDFRTDSDVSKARAMLQVLDRCECCNELCELEDGELCKGCIEWLDSEGLKDIPPFMRGC